MYVDHQDDHTFIVWTTQLLCEGYRLEIRARVSVSETQGPKIS